MTNSGVPPVAERRRDRLAQQVAVCTHPQPAEHYSLGAELFRTSKEELCA
jgi:hypothetical protein